MKYIHIGLPKCASTFLQYEVFPVIAKIKKIKFSRNSEVMKTELKKHYLRVYFNKKIKKLKFNNNSIISLEKLVGYEDPYYWEHFANKNLEAFGKENHIIIIIREPRNFLSSFYLEECVQKNYFPKPNFFFLRKENYSTQSSMKKFSLDDFSYKKLINLYKKKFKTVSVIKFEDLFDIKIFTKLFNLNEKQSVELNRAISFKKKINTSYSNSTVTFLKIINKFLSVFDLSFQLKIFRYDDLKFVNNNTKKGHYKRSKNINLKLILINIKKIFNIRTVTFSIINKILFGKKFYIDFYKYNINLSKQIKEYKKIKTIIN